MHKSLKGGPVTNSVFTYNPLSNKLGKSMETTRKKQEGRNASSDFSEKANTETVVFG